MSEEDGGKVSENHTGAGIALGVAFGVAVGAARSGASR